MSSESELIARAQSGEADAFCLLAQAYERRIYSLAFHYCRNRLDAEDLSQEVWLKAFAALTSFRNESSFYTWLRKITINCFLNHRRGHSRPLFSFAEKTDHPTGREQLRNSGEPSTGSPEGTMQNQLVAQKVMQGLSKVSAQQRLIFLLKHQEGMTYDEIAKELGCSLGTVKKSVARTVAKLREQLGVNEEAENYISCAPAGMLR